MKFFLALFKANLKQAVAMEKSFLLQMVFMFLNNIVFFCNWIILYHSVKTINGWNINDCALIYAISTFSYGIYAVLFGGTRELSRLIAKGELDTYILSPKDTLFQSISHQTVASGWGDILSSIVLIYFSGYTSLPNLVLFCFFLITSSTLIISSSIIYHSIAFWLGPVNTLSRQLMEFLIILESSPGSIYSGVLKGIVFTIIPAGFTTFLPAEVIREFNLSKLCLVVGFTVCYSLAAYAFFYLGLRRYESTSGFTVR